MNHNSIRMMLLVLGTLICGSQVLAWDLSYEGNVMPSASQLGTSKWSETPRGLPDSSTDGDVLHLVDNRTDRTVYLWRGAVAFPAGTPLTMEARVKVLAADTGSFPSWAVGLGISTVNKSVWIRLWPDRVWVGEYEEGTEVPVYVPVDMTQFHTFRLGSLGGSDPKYNIWMDNELIYSGESHGGAYYGVQFGGYVPRAEATSDSYWDYVRYSTEYLPLPVPEPSALITLAGGLGALALPLLRRKRRR